MKEWIPKQMTTIHLLVLARCPDRGSDFNIRRVKVGIKKQA
ncbi:MAG: hypothetical protein ABR903_06625 [Thermodesulfovibrionales bacterium]